jgi:hypothetical protein
VHAAGLSNGLVGDVRFAEFEMVLACNMTVLSFHDSADDQPSNPETSPA